VEIMEIHSFLYKDFFTFKESKSLSILTENLFSNDVIVQL
jgi:hypothetical protein